LAGIKVSQHKIFKIGTNRLKKNDWNIELSMDDAYQRGELISLFDSQLFRLIIKIIGRENLDWTKYVLSLVIDDKKDFYRACDGFCVNKIKFKRFVGTTGGLKKNSVIFVNENIYDELNQRVSSVTIEQKFVPAKYEAYKSLTCSASQIIAQPNNILVVTDCITNYKDTVIELNDTIKGVKEPIETLKENIDLENNASDGFNLCTIDFMKKCCESINIDYITSGMCLRNKWLKGMMYAFPIVEFAKKYNNGNFIVKDIWGNEKDLRTVDLILTESSLKLWSSYNSIEDYIKNTKESGYEFSITKISPKILKSIRELNYQYLQTFDFSEEDIKRICEPTVEYLKNSMGMNYEDTLKFIGVNEDSEDGTWQKALYLNKYMLNDNYIIENIYKLIKKKISNAKIGKLICNGDYQIASGDPFLLMQHVCGIEETGLLKFNEYYSNYWSNKGSNQILAFRSPMSIHNNIRKCNLKYNDETKYWYQYMNNIFIVNGFDTFCMAENGEDFDSDLNYLTDNPVLIKNHKVLPAIMCIQNKGDKVKITENKLRKSNYRTFGTKVGAITNYVTSMKEVQSQFSTDSEEYKILEYRMRCGQLYQQNTID
jgi:hypothetical protein